jgi:thiol-disulfide isomerase/thioredoxin
VTLPLRYIGQLLGVAMLASAVTISAAPPVPAEQLEAWRVSIVPRITLPDLDGATVDLGAQSGNLVIVHFFATWCEPCRDELRSLERLATALSAQPLRIVAIDVGEPMTRVRRFLEREKIAVRYPVLIDFDKQAMRAWGVEILPTSFVLDAGLCPLWRVAGALDWDVAPTLSILKSRIAELEHPAARPHEENCINNGGTP